MTIYIYISCLVYRQSIKISRADHTDLWPMTTAGTWLWPLDQHEPNFPMPTPLPIPIPIPTPIPIAMTWIPPPITQMISILSRTTNFALFCRPFLLHAGSRERHFLAEI